MIKITLIGARLCLNLGGPSLLVSTRKVLSKVFPEAEYTYCVPCAFYERDIALASKYDIKIIPYYINKWSLLLTFLKRFTGISIGCPYSKATIKALEQADLFVDIWGIGFSDELGSNTWRGRMTEGFDFAMAKILGKPIIKYTSDAGPFCFKWNRFFAKLYFGHFVDLILARDEATRTYIESLGIKTKMLVVPDTAFLLESRESEESEYYKALRVKCPIIGLSVSFQARDRFAGKTSYTEVMKNFVNYLIAKHSAHVVVLPNELSETKDDDTCIAEELCARVNHKNCRMVNTQDLLAQETKGIIEQCDVVVAARYHTIVAALSLGIPTLAIGWHHKYQGVLELFEQEGSLCNIKELNLKQLTGKFDEVWDNRNEIGNMIKSRLGDVKEKIAIGASTVYDLYSQKTK